MTTTTPSTALHPADPSVLEQLRSRGRFRGTLPLLGPAFVAAIAYVDPGNFATNFGAGTKYGYRLLWVIVAANLTAMLIQTLSAKVGLATGSNLAELCRDRLPRPVSRAMWVQAELVAMATDLAEILGGALALNLLFHIPLLTGGLITAAVAFAVLGLQSRGHRRFEVVITALLAVIVLGFLYAALGAPVEPGAVAAGLVPRFAGTDSLLLATGILGATVMPHVIWLHSAMTQRRLPARDTGERRRLLRYARLDVLLAMGLAGIVNAAMLIIAASLFHRSGLPGLDTIEGVHAGLARLVDEPTALAFALALLASGLASSSVGTYAGQVVMAGFLRRRVPLFVRRAVTLAPALVILAVGVDPTRALVLSQVVLSFGIPFALVPLVAFSRRRDLMGELVNRRVTTAAAVAIAVLIIALNGLLLVHTFAG